MHAGEVLLARACYERAVELDPTYGDAHFNLGATYQAQGLHHLALPYYERGVALMADPSIYLGNVLNTKMRICDWQGLDALTAQIESRVLAGQKTCPPFQVVSFSGSPFVQRKAAELWMSASPVPEGLPPFLPRQVSAAHRKQAVEAGRRPGDHRPAGRRQPRRGRLLSLAPGRYPAQRAAQHEAAMAQRAAQGSTAALLTRDSSKSPPSNP